MRRLLAVAVSVGLFVMALMAAPASATTTWGVNATPYNNGSHPWSTDGCSYVPDSGTHAKKIAYGSAPFYTYVWTFASWNFNHACIHHDGCYRGHWASKSTCDSWFLNDMRASCGAMHPSDWARRAVCNDKAWQYYSGVVALGWPAYSGWSYDARIA